MSTLHLFGKEHFSKDISTDTVKTATIQSLLDIEFEQRSEKWRDIFLENIAYATLAIHSKEVSLHQDGFPYLQVKVNDSLNSSSPFVLSQNIQTLLDHGFGLAVGKENSTQLDWVFSYGDLVNFQLNNEFYTDGSVFSTENTNLTIDKDEKILMGQPSELILPLFVRSQIKEFLVHAGISFPKVMLIARNYEDEENVSQDLVFNLTSQLFKSTSEFNQVMHTIEWFLPKHYSFFGLDEHTVDNGFLPL